MLFEAVCQAYEREGLPVLLPVVLDRVHPLRWDAPVSMKQLFVQASLLPIFRFTNFSHVGSFAYVSLTDVNLPPPQDKLPPPLPSPPPQGVSHASSVRIGSE